MQRALSEVILLCLKQLTQTHQLYNPITGVVNKFRETSYINDPSPRRKKVPGQTTKKSLVAGELFASKGKVNVLPIFAVRLVWMFD